MARGRSEAEAPWDFTDHPCQSRVVEVGVFIKSATSATLVTVTTILTL